MPFAPEHSIALAGLTVPEPSPDVVAPSPLRTFESPSGPRDANYALVGWLDGASGVVEYDVWARTSGPFASWARLERRSADGPDPGPGAIVPAGALIHVAIVSSPGSGVLRFAFRGQAPGDVDPAEGIGGVVTVSVDNFPATQAVTGSVAVSNFPATQSVSGDVSVLSLPGFPAQEHVTAASPAASRLSDGASFYVAARAGDNLGADLRVGAAAVSSGNPVPVSDAGGSLTVDSPQFPAALVSGRLPVDGSAVVQPISASSLPLPAGAALEAGNLATLLARTTLGQAAASAARPVVVAYGSRLGNSASLPSPATSFLISAVPASLRCIEWRYTGTGTKYIVLLDASSTPGTAAAWVRWYRPMSNGAGLSYWEFPTPLRFDTGIVVAVSATEPTGTLTLSANTNENFILVNACWH